MTHLNATLPPANDVQSPDNAAIRVALDRAAREACLTHARLGRSLPVGGPNGEVVLLSPAEIFARYGLDEFGRPKG